GDDYRLRLLESGRGTGLGGNRSQPFDGKCGNGEENNCGCNRANPDGAELAGAFLSEHRADHRPQALARNYHPKTETDLGAVSVALAGGPSALPKISVCCLRPAAAAARWLQVHTMALRRLIALQSSRIWAALCVAVTVIRSLAAPFATVGYRTAGTRNPSLCSTAARSSAVFSSPTIQGKIALRAVTSSPFAPARGRSCCINLILSQSKSLRSSP